MESPNGSERLQSILEDVRETEAKGRKGGMFAYAAAIYRYFDDIRELTSDGYTFATVCKFLEGKNILPADSDPRSFCRAFNREASRRKRAAKSKKAEGTHDTGKAAKPIGNSAKGAVLPVAAQKQAVVPTNPAPDPFNLVVAPDNTFNIRPIDPDDLPDL
jgi:hypothetical protein